MTSRFPIENSPPDTAPVESRQRTTDSPQLIAGWRLWLPLLLQAALVITVPAQSIFTYVTGKSVILQTAPVDPTDLLRGSYQTFSYDISNLSALDKLSGATQLAQTLQAGDSVYIVLEAPSQKTVVPPRPWKPVRVSGDRPTHLQPNQIVLKGNYDGGHITYGLEAYYIPEDQQNQINADIRQTQQNQQVEVEAKIDASGNAVPVSLWVRDRNYRF